jgi:hypothetical protein
VATISVEVSGLTGDYAAYNGIYTGTTTGDFSGLLEQTSPGTGDIFGDDVYVWALTEHGSAIPYYMCESPPPESGEWTGWYTMAGADPAPTVTIYEEEPHGPGGADGPWRWAATFDAADADDRPTLEVTAVSSLHGGDLVMDGGVEEVAAFADVVGGEVVLDGGYVTFADLVGGDLVADGGVAEALAETVGGDLVMDGGILGSWEEEVGGDLVMEGGCLSSMDGSGGAAFFYRVFVLEASV